MDHDGDFGCIGGFGDGHVLGDGDTPARAVARHEGEAVRVVQPGQPVENGVSERRRRAEEAVRNVSGTAVRIALASSDASDGSIGRTLTRRPSASHSDVS